MGSGTVLTESKLKGLNFIGIDINPLAILLGKVKNSPFMPAELYEKINILKKNINNESPFIDVDFYNIDKWFRSDVLRNLAKIRNSIKKENCLWVRRFFWIALGETVRNTSNSRTSTFKLHTRTVEEINNRDVNPLFFFSKILDRNFELYKNEGEYLEKNNYIKNGLYNKNIDVLIEDTRKLSLKNECDLIITSPPYGDNATTVPYGQYSYLPLQWIDLYDIDELISNDVLATTHAIDSSCIGGSLFNAINELNIVCGKSHSLQKYTEKIECAPRDRLNRVAAFFRDINITLPKIFDLLKRGGLIIWVLGNRKVGGMRVPFDKILTEMCESYDVRLICTIPRTIPTKRMALKNNVSKTMSKESIIVLRKD